MKPSSIECWWSELPPNIFTREVKITMSDNRDDDTIPVRAMRDVGGKPGKTILLLNGNVSASKLFHAISNAYSFKDLQRVRFAGESLTSSSYRTIRGFALEGVKSNSQLMITIESSFPDDGSIRTLVKLISGKVSLVDDICIIVNIPASSGKDDFIPVVQRVVDALVYCIKCLRTDNLRSVNLIVKIGKESSREMVDFLFGSIHQSCMEDDDWDDMRGLALNTFSISFKPEENDASINTILSESMEMLKDNLFENANIIVLPAS